MVKFLSIVFHFLPLLPGMLLAYLPMKSFLKFRPLRLAAMITALSILLCLGGGAVCYFFPVKIRLMFVPITAAMGFIYVRTLNISRWKSISVFLAGYAVFSSLSTVAIAIDGAINPQYTGLPGSFNIVLLHNLFSWIFVLVTWYPATHSIRKLFMDDSMAETWYVFWILPLLFIVLHLTFYPIQPEVLKQGHMRSLYVTIGLFLLFLLLLLYALFYFIAASLNRNNRLNKENQFLIIQQERFESLKTTIEETREMRHDMRHHFDLLLELAQKQDWESLTEYLSDARGSIPAMELHLCDNPMADSVAGHYGILFQTHDIPFSCVLDLPYTLPVSTMDLCLVLSNLLENALEASLKTAPSRRRVRVQAYLRTERTLLLTVENAFDGKLLESEGVFQSTKHKGTGMGIQSIRRIAEKNDGYTRFYYENGIFHANVMLRAEAEEN